MATDPLSALIKSVMLEVMAETFKHSDARKERLLDPQSAADYISLSRSEVYSMLNQGELPAVRHGRCVLIDKDDLDLWIKEHKGYGPKNRKQVDPA